MFCLCDKLHYLWSSFILHFFYSTNCLSCYFIILLFVLIFYFIKSYILLLHFFFNFLFIFFFSSNILHSMKILIEQAIRMELIETIGKTLRTSLRLCYDIIITLLSLYYYLIMTYYDFTMTLFLPNFSSHHFSPYHITSH
jgi:hypothetical protein